MQAQEAFARPQPGGFPRPTRTALTRGHVKDWITNVLCNGDTIHAAILIERMEAHVKEICQQERRNLDPGYNMTWGDLEERHRESMILDLENRCAADGLHLEWANNHWAANWLLYQKFNADHYVSLITRCLQSHRCLIVRGSIRIIRKQEGTNKWRHNHHQQQYQQQQQRRQIQVPTMTMI